MTLLDLCQPFLLQVATLASKPSTTAPAQEQSTQAEVEQLERQQSQMEQAIINCKVPTKLADECRFVVYIWADEQLLCSSWPGKTQWATTYQQQYVHTNCGGSEFFSRLAHWQRQADRTTSVDQKAPIIQLLELYAYCLALGFSGQYYDDQQGHVGRIKQRLMRCLQAHDPSLLGKPLFPVKQGPAVASTVLHATKPQRIIGAFCRTIPHRLDAIVLGLAVSITVGIYIAYQLLLRLTVLGV